MIPTRFELPADMPMKFEKIERLEPTDAEICEALRWLDLRSFEGDWSAFAGLNFFGALTGSEE